MHRERTFIHIWPSRRCGQLQEKTVKRHNESMVSFVSRRYMRVVNRSQVVCLSEYLPQCSKLRVRPAPGVHISVNGRTFF